MYFRYFFIISLGKERDPTWIPFNQEYFMQSLVLDSAIVLQKQMKKWNVYDNTDNDDDDDGQRTNFDQNSSLEPSPQVS